MLDETLIQYYERQADQMEKEDASDFDIALILTDMETEFQIPPLENPSWNKEHPRIIGIYRKLSSLQKLQG